MNNKVVFVIASIILVIIIVVGIKLYITREVQSDNIETYDSTPIQNEEKIEIKDDRQDKSVAIDFDILKSGDYKNIVVSDDFDYEEEAGNIYASVIYDITGLSEIPYYIVCNDKVTDQEYIIFEYDGKTIKANTSTFEYEELK